MDSKIMERARWARMRMADPGEGEADQAGAAGASPQEKPVESKLLTQDEVNKLVQTRLAREQQKWQQEYETKLAAERTEAEKMAQMSAEQRAQAEQSKREAKLAAREQEITKRELRAQALETLAEKGLPKELADALAYTDADACNASIDAVAKAFNSAVAKAVDGRLRQDPPKTGGSAGDPLQAFRAAAGLPAK
ncbi:MAG: DUF4355 domain-containing protein [Christensenellales bacterium]|jgi:flagellar biosynthesis GTPase FlhF